MIGDIQENMKDIVKLFTYLKHFRTKCRKSFFFYYYHVQHESGTLTEAWPWLHPGDFVIFKHEMTYTKSSKYFLSLLSVTLKP